jgi:hypothetical protein
MKYTQWQIINMIKVDQHNMNNKNQGQIRQISAIMTVILYVLPHLNEKNEELLKIMPLFKIAISLDRYMRIRSKKVAILSTLSDALFSAIYKRIQQRNPKLLNVKRNIFNNDAKI